MNRLTIRFLYGLVALGVVVWLAQGGWLNSDERQIRRQLAELHGLLEKDQGEAEDMAERKTHRMSALYTREFEFHLNSSEPHRLLTDREALAEAYLAYYRSGVDSIRVNFRNQTLELDSRQGSAAMKLEAVVTSTWQDSVHKGRDVWALDLLWEQEDGDWRLRRCILEAGDSRAVRSLF